jgi:hypothetical protein
LSKRIVRSIVGEVAAIIVGEIGWLGVWIKVSSLRIQVFKLVSVSIASVAGRLGNGAIGSSARHDGNWKP